MRSPEFDDPPTDAQIDYIQERFFDGLPIEATVQEGVPEQMGDIILESELVGCLFTHCTKFGINGVLQLWKVPSEGPIELRKVWGPITRDIALNVASDWLFKAVSDNPDIVWASSCNRY